MATDLTDFKLPRDSYATFDAQTLKQLIRTRLNEGGVFTDQNFEGSNLNAIIDIVALSYHYLLFYLNETGSQAMFNEATVYENMNRIVKLIDYKPTGYKTSLLSFQATATSSLPAGIYTIPRYSYLAVNGISYSFLKDTTFSKLSSGEEYLTSLSDQVTLYQGKVVEYPEQIATGENFETFTVVVKDTITNIPVNIDQDGFTVYVKAPGGDYVEYTQTTSLFLETSNARKYELRYNEQGYYELKFGNNVFGQSLVPGSSVYIYYIRSDGAQGIVSANQINGSSLTFYSTPQFKQISADVFSTTLNYINASEASAISFANDLASSPPNTAASVEDIRQNAPKTFYSQNRLITSSDFESFIEKNFNNIVIDSAVVNNSDYIDSVIAYYYSLGITRPNDDPRVAFNEFTYSHSGQANNVYMYVVPRIRNVDETNKQYFLQNSQKNQIISAMSSIKALHMEIVPQDPIYTAVTLGLAEPGEVLTPEIANDTYLVIKKSVDVRVDVDSIKSSVNNVFKQYFNAQACTLGQLVSMSDLVSGILSVPGVSSFSMRRVTSTGVISNSGLTLLVFNPNYSDVDIQVYATDIQLPFFKFPFLYNGTVLPKIIVE